MTATNKKTKVIAAVEGGGTSFKCVVCEFEATGDQLNNLPKIIHRIKIDSSHDDPHRTLRECSEFFVKHKPQKDGESGCYDGLGIATFGPVGVNKDHPETYGKILASSPKANWRNVDILRPIREACFGANSTTPTDRKNTPLPVLVDTDVNAPAVAEYRYHDKQGAGHDPISSCAYITVGTGVGVGLVVNGKPVHGMMHPEGGHVPILPLDEDQFQGYSWGKECSPFQGKNTVEGIACSVSLTERYYQLHDKNNKNNDGAKNLDRNVLADLPDDHELWDHCANALACLCVTLILTLSIEKIVLGGGIMSRNGLIDKIRTQTMKHINGYLDLSETDLKRIITLSEFGQDAGLVGSIVLAQQAALLLQDDNQTDIDGRGNNVREMKQIAYGTGMWHGMMVGAIGMGLFVKYIWPGGKAPSSSRR